MTDVAVEDLLRGLAPQVLGAVVRRFGHFDTAEDAVQEALLAAAMQWPAEGLPDNPRAWLITVASRRLTDLLRSEQARQRREETVYRWTLASRRGLPAVRRRRHAHPAVHVLPPGVVAAVADRADAAGRRRPHHGGDRPRVPGPRGDDDPPDHPGQADDQGERAAVLDATAAGARGPAGRRAARPLPDLQRGVRRARPVRRSFAPSWPTRRSGWPGCCTACCPTNPRWPGCSP